MPNNFNKNFNERIVKFVQQKMEQKNNIPVSEDRAKKKLSTISKLIIIYFIIMLSVSLIQKGVQLYDDLKGQDNIVVNKIDNISTSKLVNVTQEKPTTSTSVQKNDNWFVNYLRKVGDSYKNLFNNIFSK